MLFQEYIELVVEDYHHKSAESSISMNLIHPTPAKIKEQCIIEFSKSVNRKDENMLLSFFGTPSESSSIYRLIVDFDLDKFRPLEYYLKKKTITTDHKNIELLAWLIDFKGRPFDPRKPLSKGSDPPNNPGQVNPIQPLDEPVPPGPSGGVKTGEPIIIDVVPPPTKPGSNMRIRITIAILSLMLVISAFAFWQINRRQYGKTYENDSQCMYWAGDRYQPISCSEKLRDTIVVALDSFKLRNFKRITTPDTITKMSIGNVWYIKRNGTLEYYTSSGFHPVDFQRRLKPITSYIIEKYIQSGHQ